MSDAPRIYIEEWSAISPGDLGLKAGYLENESESSVVFRDIVGWVTINGRDMGETMVSHGFRAVVIGEIGAPMLAHHIAGYVGTFLKSMTSAEALKKSQEWRGRKEEQAAVINVTTVGKA